MNGPATLARPLAARARNLPAPHEAEANRPVSEAVIDAAMAALNAGHTHYTDRPGILPLRQQIADALNRGYGLALNADQVTITCGATEARFVALKVLATPGSTVLSSGDVTPIAGAAALIGVELAEDDDSASVVYLTPNGDRTRTQALCERALERRWWVIWDMAAGEATDAFHPAQDPALTPFVVTVGSFSRALPGWRVGWMAGSQMAGKMRAYKQSMTICTTSISQWAALGLET